jgi:hypothetical protein
LEVQTLKALASAATKGATASPEVQTYSGVTQQPKKVGLNTIGVKPAAKITTQQRPTVPVPKPLQNKPIAPVKRQKNELEIEKILIEEGISREEYERQYDPNYKPLNKPLHKMTEQELRERNKQALVKRAVPNNAIPMPTAEQEEMIHTQRAQAASVNPNMQRIMNALINQKK